jgi:hypothetical protein
MPPNMKSQGDLEYVGRIYESLHGFIHFTKVEREIIDSPYFQRLRYIKQLGMVNLVFPGGEHTRFSHSLGVLWVMDRICRHLKFPPERRQKLRLAALLHDIGHFPFSHTIEAVYIQQEKEGAKAKASGFLQTARPKPATFSRSQGHPEEAQLHERLSAHIITRSNFCGGIGRILKNNGFDPIEIGLIVVGSSADMLFNQLMHSELDADKMDYLIRDAVCLNVGYGLFDIEYLIECFTTRRMGRQEILCIIEKGVHAVEHYLLARYFYHIEILFHRVRYIIEKAVGKIYQIMMSNKVVGVPQLEDLFSFSLEMEKWSHFDDPWLIAKIREMDVNGVLPDWSTCLLDIVLRRRLPECTYQKTLNLTKGAPSNKQVLDNASREMERASDTKAKGLNHARIQLHQMKETFEISPSIEERITKGVYRDREDLLMTDRDVIRIVEKDTSRPARLIAGDASSFAYNLSLIETHVLRAYRLRDRTIGSRRLPKNPAKSGYRARKRSKT